MRSLAPLPNKIYKKVTEFLDKFIKNPTSPGINYEKINACRDKKMRSVRIDDTYRGIVSVQEETGTHMLLWVDHHDEAYAWARRRQCDVNSVTGAIQVFCPTVPEEVLTQYAAPTDEPIFANVSDRELLALGVPEMMLPTVRLTRSVEDFEQWKDYLPSDAATCLECLAEGDSIEDVWMLIDALPAAPVSDDMSQALHNPVSQMNFIVVDSNDELRRMLDAPLERWRVFLHPTQRTQVTKDYNGPACVLGGAGTGKTVVAIHRARRLAGMLEGNDKVLVTTFTKTLTADLQNNLEKICKSGELQHIEVQNLDAWAHNYLKEHGSSPEIVYHGSPDRLKTLWEKALEEAGADDQFPVSFYEDEYTRVVLPNDINSLEEYLDAPRKGRGNRLGQQQRARIWPVFEEYRRLMQEMNVRDIDTAMHECTELLSAHPETTGYRHVVVDEAQDFSPNALRMIRAIAGEEHPNDLFIVGDARQRIYKNRAVLSNCGINVRGRTSELRVNYRTTAETRSYALALLEGVPFDNLDAGQNEEGFCRSMTHGLPPQVDVYRTFDEELDAVIDEIQRLISEEGVSGKNICIVARTNNLTKTAIKHAGRKDLPCYELKNQKSDERDVDGVRIATMHRAKGLEFQYVFIIAANRANLPLPQAIDKSSPQRRQESITAEKCLLHVAVTRAQKRAYISAHGKLSEFVQPMQQAK